MALRLQFGSAFPHGPLEPFFQHIDHIIHSAFRNSHLATTPLVRIPCSVNCLPYKGSGWTRFS